MFSPSIWVAIVGSRYWFKRNVVEQRTIEL